MPRPRSNHDRKHQSGPCPGPSCVDASFALSPTEFSVQPTSCSGSHWCEAKPLHTQPGTGHLGCWPTPWISTIGCIRCRVSVSLLVLSGHHFGGSLGLLVWTIIWWLPLYHGIAVWQPSSKNIKLVSFNVVVAWFLTLHACKKHWILAG